MTRIAQLHTANQPMDRGEETQNTDSQDKVDNAIIIWAASRENLSSGFTSNRDSNHSPQRQRLARILKFRLKQA